MSQNKAKENKINKKTSWKPGNMVYPLPAALVTCRDLEGNENALTIAWTGTVCTNPPMLYISVRKERFSYHMIEESGEFVLNLTTKDMVKQVDHCGVCSGREEDKFEVTGLTRGKAKLVNAPIIMESPVNIECRVKQILPLGSHDMFLADVVNVMVSEEFIDEKGSFDLAKSGLIAYSHGKYYELGKQLGSFGYSVRKKDK